MYYGVVETTTTLDVIDDPSAMKIKDIVDKLKSDPSFPVYITATVVKCTVKRTKVDKPFLEVVLRDDSGTVSAKKFLAENSDVSMFRRLYSVDNVLDISGTYDKEYKSVNIECESVVGQVEPTTVVENTAVVDDRTTTIDIDELTIYLKATIQTVSDQWLLSLLRSVFNDKPSREQFFTCPAAFSNHHNYKGGLLHHVVSMLKMLDTIVSEYPDHHLNVDVLRTGIILHDIGKTKVYTLENGKSSYINPDKRLDHVKIGDVMIAGLTANIDGFPPQLKETLHGIIISHPGKKEWGALREPRTYEEQVVHYLDVLDARFGRRSGRQDDV
jgi:3'-5' exoribonuclease